MENKKRKSPILILTIIFSSFIVIFLTISIITSVLLVKRCENAINEIGEVKLEEEIENKIDKAEEYYTKLDTNISLNERVYNSENLKNAKYNYVRLAIKKANVSYSRRIVDKISEADIKKLVNSANNILEKYFKADQYEEIEGYKDFKSLLDIYKEEKDSGGNQQTPEAPAEEPEIC